MNHHLLKHDITISFKTQKIIIGIRYRPADGIRADIQSQIVITDLPIVPVLLH